MTKREKARTKAIKRALKKIPNAQWVDFPSGPITTNKIVIDTENFMIDSKHQPCGCLTDGYNWLKECDEHQRIRRERSQAAQLLRELLDYIDGEAVGIRGNHAPRVAAALLKKWGL